MGSVTFIYIFTAVARAVQHEASITLTVEAAWGVPAVSMGATEARLGQALVIIEASLVVLREARRTAAGEGAYGVDTDELAVVLPGGALVQVFAGPEIFLHQVATGASAQKGALCVFAEEGTWLWVMAALVHIHAGSGSGIWCIPIPAVTVEGTNAIDTLAMVAQVSKHVAFVHILALGAVALAMGAELPVGRGARQGTELTMGAPSPAASAAALDSGHSLTAA